MDHPKKSNLTTGALAVTSILGLTLIAALFSCTKSLPGGSRLPVESPGQEIAEVDSLIREGDVAFRDYRYDKATYSYARAKRNLAALLEFENASPARDIARLQHYQNIQTLLRARIELVLIAEEISSGHPPDPLSPAHNQTPR